MNNQPPYGSQSGDHGGWLGQQPPPPGPHGYPQPTPPGQHFGQPPPQFGQQYGGPPPRKKRTGLFVALGLLVLVLVGGGITLALTLGNDDDSGSSNAEKQDQEGEEGVEGSNDVADPDVTLQGDGYSFGLAEGWSDVTDQIGEFSGDAPPEGLDVMVMIREGDHAGDNILVQKSDAEGETDPEALKDDWAGSLLRTEIEERDPLDFDGADSVAITSQGTTDGGNEVVYHGFLMIHDGSAYSVLLTAGMGDEGHVTEVLEMVEDSWTWE